MKDHDHGGQHWHCSACGNALTAAEVYALMADEPGGTPKAPVWLGLRRYCQSCVEANPGSLRRGFKVPR